MLSHERVTLETTSQTRTRRIVVLTGAAIGSSRMPRPHFFVLIVTLPIVPVNLLIDRV
jgi:hypothetical protein